MHLVNPFIFAKKEPNTFIGGVSSYITSKAAFVAVTNGLLESDITHFAIIGSDVYMQIISNSYQLNNGINSSLLVSFIDFDGLCSATGSSTLNGSPNLLYAFLPNSADGFVGAAGGWNSGGFRKTVRTERALTGNAGRNFLNNSEVEILILTNRTSITLGAVTWFYCANMSMLKRCHLPNLSSINLETALFDCYFNNVNPSAKFYLHPDLDEIDRNSYVKFNIGAFSPGQTFTANGLVYTATNYEPTTNGEFRVDNVSPVNGIARLKNAINADTRTGTLGDLLAENSGFEFVLIQNAFVGVAGNATQYIDRDTGLPVNFINGYAKHPFVIYVESLGCTVVYVDNIISADAPTGLSYSNLTGTSVDLNFTAPTPNANGIGGYEVWVNNGEQQWKVMSLCDIANTGDTVDLSELSVISGTIIKIRQFDGQMNYSEFTDPITLPI